MKVQIEDNQMYDAASSDYVSKETQKLMDTIVEKDNIIAQKNNIIAEKEQALARKEAELQKLRALFNLKYTNR